MQTDITMLLKLSTERLPEVVVEC